MKSKIAKCAAAAFIIISVLTSFHYFNNFFENVAFADVIQKFQNSSYIFDAKTIGNANDGARYHFMVLLSKGCRMDVNDPSQGTYSSIINFNTGDMIRLNHEDKIAITELPESEDLFHNGPFAMFLNPVEDVWDMLNGSETPVGEKEIDGVLAVGFKFMQKGDNYINNTIIWADRETATPVHIEITLQNQDNSHAVRIILNNFDLNVQLDEKLFSTIPPEEYKAISYQQLEEESVSVNSQQ